MRRAALIGAFVVVLAAGCEAEPECTFLPAFASVSPSGGDGLVPTDASVWVRLDTDEPRRCFFFDVALINLDDGRERLEDPVQIASPGRLLLRNEPTGGLAPDADYEVVWSVNRPGSRDGNPVVVDSGVVSFRTDSGPALDAPAVPVGIGWTAEVAEPALISPFGGSSNATDWLEIWTTEGRFLLVMNGPPDDGLPEEVWRLGEHGHLWSDARLSAGRTLSLRFASLAVNGQLSDWSEPATLTVPAAGGYDEGVFEQ